MNKDNNIKYLIKNIYMINKKVIKIIVNKGEKKFALDYHVADEYAKATRQSYYFGTDLNYTDFKGYLKIFKELLRVKRFLKTYKK